MKIEKGRMNTICCYINHRIMNAVLTMEAKSRKCRRSAVTHG